MLVIFLTVFIDLVGFGIVIPLSPYLARAFDAGAFEVGVLMALYSAAQFLFSPFWGGVSDRIGRRPVILVSLLGASLSHLFFAFATELWMLFLARFIAGFFGANISTAMAYMADISDKKNRTAAMGLIGAAFGLGFILGPFIGAVSGEWGLSLGVQPPFGQSFAAVVAAGICFFNFVLASFLLKESLPLEKRSQKVELKGLGRVSRVLSSLKRPVLGKLQGLYFLYNLALSFIEACLFLLVQDRYSWSLFEAGLGFAYVGVIMAFTQGYLVRKVLKNISHIKMLSFGVACLVLAYGGIALSQPLSFMALSVTLLALGCGLVSPALSGMISQMAGEKEQGQVLGVNQSLAALSRILGPLIGGALYQHLSPESPFLSSMWICLLLFYFLLQLKGTLEKQVV